MSEKNLYWGDIHNHNAIGYARGSLERSYDIARGHLDFYCFTGHSQWHDMNKIPNKHDQPEKWIRGFEVVRENWGKIVGLANEYNLPGEFVSFSGYEWHSSAYGDVCIVFPSDEAELVYIDHIRELQKFARERGAFLIPHHPAYREGRRGQNWSLLDTSVSPVVEIYSEHGNAESDRSPLPYISHSLGGRYTKTTLQWLWQQGIKAGVVASTDNHLGYPGAYGEGLVAVYADSLTRESIFEAIKARRTYGVSGDRIGLDLRLNGHAMGETIPSTTERQISVRVEGKDVIDRVEVLRNNQVIYRDHPIDCIVQDSSWGKPVLCRVEFGWGPWVGLDMARVCDWRIKVMVDRGKVVSATPCFQSGPFDEERRNKLTNVNEGGCEIVSYTSRREAFRERATNGVILEIEGTPETELKVMLTQPIEASITKSLKELAESSDILHTGPFGAESLLLHRIAFADNYQTEFEFTDEARTGETDWYYMRVNQTNGSLAWSSPIWVEVA